MLCVSDIRRQIIHRFLQSQKNSFRKEEMMEKLEELKKEEENAVMRLGYSVYANGDAGKYGRPGTDLLAIEDDIQTAEILLRKKEKKLKN